MVQNKFGKKIIGAALSMAMVVTAIPAMTSLACERDYRHHPQAPVAPHVQRDNRIDAAALADRYIEVANFYYENEAKLPENVIAVCQQTLCDISMLFRNTHISHRNLERAAEALEDLYITVEYFANEADTATAERDAALQNLYDVLNEMFDFECTFYDELEAVVDIDDFNTWIAFGTEVYLNSDGYSAQDINDLSDTLNRLYMAAIEAIDSASQPEEIAPDYGMDPYEQPNGDGFEIDHQDDFTISPDFQIDPQDSFTIGGEEEQPEDVAPDYGMDLDEGNGDGFVIENVVDETIGDETTDETTEDETVVEETVVEETIVEETTEEETVVEETTVEPTVVEIVVNVNINDNTASATTEAPATTTESAPVAAPAAPAAAPAASSAPAAPSAPATMVAGASRSVIDSRESMVDQLVERLYSDALNRKSDAVGKTYWVNMILSGNDNVDSVICGFLNSAEFNARNLDDEQFVIVLYRTVLNRVPSATEKSLWVNALANGATRSDVINAFVNSSEFDATCDAYSL